MVPVFCVPVCLQELIFLLIIAYILSVMIDTVQGGVFTQLFACSSCSQCKGNPDIIIPEGTISIDPIAFQNCDTLISVTIPTSVESIFAFSFQDSHNLQTVTFLNPELSSLIYIGESAFLFCLSLRFISLPPSLLIISNYVFHYCEVLFQWRSLEV
jgi:hypothetical protein